MLRDRWQYLLLAVILAVFTWYLVSGREKVEAWVTFGVEMVNPPEGLVIRKGLINKIEVRVRGPKGLVRALDQKRLAYPLDVAKVKVGDNQIDIEADKVPLSMAYEIVEIKPNRVILSVDRVGVKKVPVQLVLKKDVPADYTLVEQKLIPAEVEVRGPESVLKRVTQVKAQLGEAFERPPEAWSGNVSVTQPEEVEANPAVVRVELKFAAKTRLTHLKVPVVVRCPEGLVAKASPAQVVLLVDGPSAALRDEDVKKNLRAVVELDRSDEPGRVERPYRLEVPGGLRILRQTPEKVQVRIKKK
jgi:YbbR domain-containing protein